MIYLRLIPDIHPLHSTLKASLDYWVRTSVKKQKGKMKYSQLILVAILFSNCQAQPNKLLISERLISDWSKYPIFTTLIDENSSVKEWKENTNIKIA